MGCFLSKARNAYYSGQPLIVDDMFDKVEVNFALQGLVSVCVFP